MVVSFSDPDMPSSTEWITGAMLEGVDAVQGDTRWEEGSLKLFRLAAERRLPSVLDLDRAPKNKALIGAPSHAAFSEAGLAEASGESDPATGLRAIAREGYGNSLIVTLGGNGVMWLEGDELRHFPAFQVKVVDTLAAGDVWHGAFTLALGEGLPQAEAIRFATAAAALKCTQFGGRAGTPSRQAIDAFRKEHKE
jgi:sulfofructose kinase